MQRDAGIFDLGDHGLEISQERYARAVLVLVHKLRQTANLLLLSTGAPNDTDLGNAREALALKLQSFEPGTSRNILSSRLDFF